MFIELNARAQNGFLTSLRPEDLETIRPYLRTAELSYGRVLQRFGEPLDEVYFPHNCVISRVLELDAGEGLEIGLIGRDTLLGAIAATGMAVTKYSAVVVWPGAASILDINRLREAAERSPALNKLLARHGQALIVNFQQAVTCKAMHALDARLARCLLQMQDLTGSDRFMLSQEIMAQMIGARGNSVSIVVRTLEQQNQISYRRGQVVITDPEGLTNTACNCYATIRAQNESLLRDTGLSHEWREVSV